jgi:hypothetical protein
MGRFVFVAAIASAMLGGCTPPRVYLEGYEPPPIRGGIANQGYAHGSLSGRTGSVTGANGIAFFSTQPQMYQALAELVGGPIAQGAATYKGFEVTHTATSDPHIRAVETLQSRATQSAREQARREGDVLVSVAFHAGPPERDGSYLLRVETLLESPSGVRHRESRDAVVRPRGPGEPYDIRWLGPPRLELRRD